MAFIRDNKTFPGAAPGEFQNSNSFAALKDDGSVITWGMSSRGGDSSAVSRDLGSGVSQVFSTGSAFAALKDDGSVVTWGTLMMMTLFFLLSVIS